MKFSIIIPVYNAELFLDQCVNSILNQSFKDYEIILVNDDSPDNCPQICDEYARSDERVKVIHKDNGGVSSARNAGIEQASGDYIIFLDSDDTLLENSLEEAKKFINENRNYDVIFCNYIDSYEGEKTPISYSNLDKHIQESKNGLELIDKIILTNAINPCWNKIYNAKLIKDNELYFENLIFAEDLSWALNLLLLNPKCIYSNIYLMEYKRFRIGAITQQVNIKKEIDKIKFCNIWINDLNITDNIRTMLANIYISTIYDYYRFTKKERAMFRTQFQKTHCVFKQSKNKKNRYKICIVKVFGLYGASFLLNLFIKIKNGLRPTRRNK